MGARTTGGRARLLARFGLAAASVVLALGLLEAGSRIFRTFEGPLQPLRIGHLEFFGRHDPLLFWRLRPGIATDDGAVRINGHGLRGPDLSAKPPGEVRILSLGESTTFGAKLAYEETYSALLEQRLNEAPGASPVRVLNAGVPGYSLFQGVQFLLHRSEGFEPDMVLLYFGYNDFLPIAFLAQRASDAAGDTGGLNDWELFEERQSTMGRLVSFLIEYSNLARGLFQLGSRDRSGLKRSAHRTRVPDEHRARLLEMALKYCRERGIELVVVVPIYREFSGHAALLRSFVRENGVSVVDLPAVLPARFTGPREAYFSDDAHPTPAGHALIAEAIHEGVAPKIQEHGKFEPHFR